MKFIDLFAGLGGFHLALKSLGHTCIFASEIDPSLRELYKKNFGIEPKGDITKIENRLIPIHDILCAGFPCTPFSRAGKRNGRNDKKNGKLFDEIIRILEYRKPKYFILENVSNLFYHDNNKTWKYIERKLINELGYSIDKRIYSPFEFGIPHNRKRIFIVGSLGGLNNFEWIDQYKVSSKPDIHSILDKKTNNHIYINSKQKKCITVWQEFLDVIPPNESLDFPIWASEFGATYPYDNETPFSCSFSQLKKFRGSLGTKLKGKSKEEIFKLLPSYARVEQSEFPDWKKRFIRLNREFYKKYKKELVYIIPKIKELAIPSWQKFEWNCQNEPRIIKNYILQFRASGLRVKKNNFTPSLVCPNTQIPIIGWENRYISRSEALRLHSMEELKYLPENNTSCFKALGNALNVTIVKLIAQNLVGKAHKKDNKH
jgi:DNA (cytosine-5)-methyltransferase 1